MNKILKIGVIVDNCMVRSWEYSTICAIHESDFASISLIIKNRHNTSTSILTRINSFPFRLNQIIDRLVFKGDSDYSDRKDLCGLLKEVPLIDLDLSKNENDEFLSSDALDLIKKSDLDFAIKLGYGLMPADIHDVPAYGSLSFSMNNYLSEKEDTTGYYEVVRKNPVTVSELILGDKGGKQKRVINRIGESTCSYSINLNRDKLFRRASLCIPRVLKGIFLYGNDYLIKLTQNYSLQKSQQHSISVPSFFRSSGYLIHWSIIFLQKIIKKILFTDPFSWVLLFNIGPANNFQQHRYESFTSLQPSKDKFWADPFVICRDEKYYLFVEEFIYSKNKGHISVLEMDGEGALLQVQKVLEKPYHMSYPFVFESDNVFYMIPETGGNRTIDLYKCAEFPGNWIFVKSLMENVNAVDSTIFQYNKKWWLFTVIDKIDSKLDSSPELYLFFTDDFLSGNWTSHPMNPIVADVRSARPAGKIFVMEGKIYRPSQDCAGRYGNSFDFNQITVLTKTEYAEERILKVSPSWDRRLKGAHTFNFDNDFTVIDAYTYRRRFFEK